MICCGWGNRFGVIWGWCLLVLGLDVDEFEYWVIDNVLMILWGDYLGVLEFVRVFGICKILLCNFGCGDLSCKRKFGYSWVFCLMNFLIIGMFFGVG